MRRRALLATAAGTHAPQRRRLTRSTPYQQRIALLCVQS